MILAETSMQQRIDNLEQRLLTQVKINAQLDQRLQNMKTRNTLTNNSLV